MLLDSVEEIEAAIKEGDGTQIRLIAHGHLAYSRAMHFYTMQDTDKAEPLFREAQSSLEAAGSYFSLLPEFYLAILAYYADSGKGGVLLVRLKHRIDGERYGDLLGLVH